jgi:transposase
VAKRFRVSLGVVKKLLQQRRQAGEIEARHRFSGRKARLLPERGQELKGLVAREPDITLAEIKGRLGLACTIPAIHQVLVKLGLTYKKRRSMRPGKIGLSNAQKRRRWKRGQGGLDPARLVFIDESAAKTNMTRLRGRSPRGKRLVCHAPHCYWCTTTMISSVRLDGTTACMTSSSFQ